VGLPSTLATPLAISTTNYKQPYDIAIIYTGLRDKDRALTWLQEACDGRVREYSSWEWNPWSTTSGLIPDFRRYSSGLGYSVNWLCKQCKKWNRAWKLELIEKVNPE
jgi:hypothetical protein